MGAHEHPRLAHVAESGWKPASCRATPTSSIAPRGRATDGLAGPITCSSTRRARPLCAAIAAPPDYGEKITAPRSCAADPSRHRSDRAHGEFIASRSHRARRGDAARGMVDHSARSGERPVPWRDIDRQHLPHPAPAADDDEGVSISHVDIDGGYHEIERKRDYDLARSAYAAESAGDDWFPTSVVGSLPRPAWVLDLVLDDAIATRRRDRWFSMPRSRPAVGDAGRGGARCRHRRRVAPPLVHRRDRRARARLHALARERGRPSRRSPASCRRSRRGSSPPRLASCARRRPSR